MDAGPDSVDRGNLSARSAARRQVLYPVAATRWPAPFRGMSGMGAEGSMRMHSFSVISYTELTAQCDMCVHDIPFDFIERRGLRCDPTADCRLTSVATVESSRDGSDTVPCAHKSQNKKTKQRVTKREIVDRNKTNRVREQTFWSVHFARDQRLYRIRYRYSVYRWRTECRQTQSRVCVCDTVSRTVE